jgi:phosphoribosylglycinamide formyltransferase 2
MSVVLGTPGRPSATRVMLLGSGELGKEVVIAFQRLGVEVIAVDRYANAPAHQVAHRSYVIDMTDASALRTLIVSERPHHIIPEIEAIATQVLIAMEAEGYQVTPTAQAAFLTMNREGIRRFAAETLGLPTSPYCFASTLEEVQSAADALGYPCFVKPIMSSSGKGQSRLTAAEQAPMAWSKAKEAARVDLQRVIVEGAIEFEFEITLLTVRSLDSNGQPSIQFCEPVGHRQVEGDYVESWQPQRMSAAALERAQAIARRIVEGLGGQGIFGVELFVRGDEVWFSEVSPRPHDTGMVTLCTQRLSEFELHARAILGLPVDTSLRRPGASAVIYGGQDATDLCYEGIDQALAVPESDLRLFGKPQSYVRRRMGVALANADTPEEALSRALATASAVRPRAL